jgi:hypothetical protein
MTRREDPLKDPLRVESDPTFTVVALLKHTPTSRATVSTVKLAKDWGVAEVELQRMIDVSTETLGPKPGLSGGGRTYTIERGRGWAHVAFAGGISYHFSVQRARWAKKEEAKA